MSSMTSSGSVTHRVTLEGSTEGITCIDFDSIVSSTPEPEPCFVLSSLIPVSSSPQGSRVLAASYDKSALLWRLNDPVPKVTRTKYCCNLNKLMVPEHILSFSLPVFREKMLICLYNLRPPLRITVFS